MNGGKSEAFAVSADCEKTTLANDACDSMGSISANVRHACGWTTEQLVPPVQATGASQVSFGPQTSVSVVPAAPAVELEQMKSAATPWFGPRHWMQPSWVPITVRQESPVVAQLAKLVG
jgi:hypothetical protein